MAKPSAPDPRAAADARVQAVADALLKGTGSTHDLANARAARDHIDRQTGR